MSQDSLPKNKIPIIRVPARPSDLNEGGTVFGGWIMSQVDIAGSIPAAIAAGGTIVTRAVDAFEFKKPVFAGDLVSCFAEIVKVGKTSITVSVEVFAERMTQQGVMTSLKVTQARLVYVAIDEKGKPRVISK